LQGFGFRGKAMRRSTLALLSAVSVVALAHMASAADLAKPVYKAPPPPPPPVQDWSGVYVGIEGGYGWGKQNINPAFDPFLISDPWFCFKFSGGCTDPTVSSVSQSGWLGGGFAGVQKQWGSWVLGLEAGIDGADINGSTTSTNSQTACIRGCEEIILAVPLTTTTSPRLVTLNQSQTINAKVDALGFAGPKVGWAFSPNWMIYATGGLAWAHVQDDASQSQSVSYCNGAIGSTCPGGSGPSFAFSESGGVSMFGWAAGAGLDYKWQVDAGSAVILGVRYLHYGFGNESLVVADNQFGTGANFGLNTKESVDVVTGRLSWLFSIH
jgi:outer membrane immunogenic protein